MTLTDRKGNIRGREFPTDTGIDGNACEETTKDQRWVGLYRQIPDTDTRPISLSLSPPAPSLARSPSLSRSFSPALALALACRTSSPHLSSPDIRPFVRTTRSTVHAHRSTHCHEPPHDVPRHDQFPRWGSARAPFPVETTATAADIAPRPPSLTARCLMIPGTSKSTRPIPIR